MYNMTMLQSEKNAILSTYQSRKTLKEVLAASLSN